MADPSETPSKSAAETPSAVAEQTPAVDVQGQINQALLEHDKQREAELRAELKEIVGFESLKEFKEAQLSEQGKTQELLDGKSKELAVVTKRFQDSQINAALLGAASASVDPNFVAKHLADQCQCDENGNVTVDGQSPADAVAALLKEKTFLAKAEGDAGSGAPTQTEGKNTLTRAAFDALSPLQQSEHFKNGGSVV